MFNRKMKNVEIFMDTEQMYRTNNILKEVIENSIQNQKLILSNDVVEVDNFHIGEGKVVVSPRRTLEASETYAKEGKRVCVLNFASATNPGGGVLNGSSAQEEAICRCSTLYPCLSTREMWDNFYAPHRNAGDSLYNDDCIFIPAVKVFKKDINFPETMPEDDWWDVDVITCAAPNLRSLSHNIIDTKSGRRRVEITYEKLKALHMSRIKKIFEVAIANKADVLILGAFGCGAFWNPPEIVAEVFAEFTEKYRKHFDTIEYAVFHTERETKNFVTFKEAMKRFDVN